MIVGGYGVGNIGDEAILSGLLKNASANISKITVVTHDVKETRRLHSDETPKRTKLKAVSPSKIQLIRELVKNDHFLFGGGGLFSHYMGPYAKKIPHYATAAKALGKSVHWTAIGVYSSTPTMTKKGLKFSMKNSDNVSVRDPVSKDVLNNIGVSPVKLVDDPATKLEPKGELGSKSLYEQGIDTNEPIFAIAARKVKNARLNQQLFHSYIHAGRELKDRGFNVVLMPFCKHSYEPTGMDHRTCEAVSEELGKIPIVSYNHPKEALSIVSQFDGILTTRLHSMIFANISATPFVAIEYADKVSSLLDSYGKSSQGIPLDEVNERIVMDKIQSEILELNDF
ncbi:MULTISPECIES: polysaccharide pyruvyl transferase family protein [Haloarcula]|uniref:polysaccharide pyruvyl transferase family protein n=1 Tax=Haloarcula TaxID=2237 RepID=UPI0013DE8A47|nr:MULTISPECIES: polysaccharide pyruvyl transferase family protein [Haloarcula]NHX38169.1 hypothetical protein [Haloarcula sp. R1-2]